MKNPGAIKNILLVRLAQGVCILLSLMWLIFGVSNLLQADASAPGLALLLAGLMVGNAALLGLCAWAVGQQRDKLDYLVLSVLILNLSLTITDQFGWLDALVLVFYVILLGLVVMLRSRRKGLKHADQQRTDRASQDGAAPEDTGRG